MFISSIEIETIMSREFTVRLSQWISTDSPVRHELGHDHAIRFDIDEALEFCKIKMLRDSTKKEFFPYLVKLKNHQVCGRFDSARSA